MQEKKKSITSLFKKGLSENLFKTSLIANLFKKGLIENPISGVINRQRGVFDRKILV
ncbi:hypothetical protein [Methanosarcina sp.]|uniref:hypothetical protein n=1 Tax=Methanosarcina sp. TaxID=2213 RepID=UPI003C71D87B